MPTSKFRKENVSLMVTNNDKIFKEKAYELVKAAVMRGNLAIKSQVSKGNHYVSDHSVGENVNPCNHCYPWTLLQRITCCWPSSNQQNCV